jgi:3-hydroxybutyrate dehydrogenase
VRLKDKAAIITGAASGIGKEISIVFAREGAKVAIADLDQKAADATAKEIDPAGTRAIGIAMDVTNEDQVEFGTSRVIKAFGALDVLVSNAGIQIVSPVVDFDFAKWKLMLAIHLDGAFLTTRAALRQMYKQNSAIWGLCTRRKRQNSRHHTSRQSMACSVLRGSSPRKAPTTVFVPM